MARVELLDGRVRRVHAQGAFAGAAREAQRGLGQTGLGIVVRQVGVGAIEAAATQLFERLGDATVQHAPLAGEQAGVDGLAGERVAKGELVGGFLDDQPGRDQLLDDGQRAAPRPDR